MGAAECQGALIGRGGVVSARGRDRGSNSKNKLSLELGLLIVVRSGCVCEIYIVYSIFSFSIV